ncbi:PepSY domain-containing protein [Sporosarcina pasteurii]|uniref:Peptidase propeptide and YPEB domain n=1 Tax=Sporosarcina pasteurii TaxID=1474 RepID=A0A380BBT1_SPOPA|nr:PepSY domain-containing protein [Sporosarcina pasteurii]MDS9472426.1 PepSY domain-containing protein [Sporosarcina pasteurii]SUI98853.1 Peptidase propeptide and YPEB domain [Sporosarcina pasteurii]
MKKLISVLGLSVVIVFAGAAMFANASSNNVVEEGVLGVTEKVNELQVVPTKQKAESTVEKTQSKSKLTVEEAIAIARQHASGTVKEVELDNDDGRLYYEIEMKDGKYEYELEIDAYTGDVLDFEKDLED